MKRNVLLAVVLSIFFTVPNLFAETVPTEFYLITGFTLNATADVDSAIQNLTRAAEPDGNFTIALDASSATGDADVMVEVYQYNPASKTWSTTFYNYNNAADVLTTYNGVVIDSTFTRFARDGAFLFFPVGIPLVGQFYVKVTGVGSNPADTIVTLVLIRK